MKKLKLLIALMTFVVYAKCQNIGSYPAYTFTNIDKSYLALYDSTHTYNVSSHTYKWSLAQLKAYLTASGFGTGSGTVTSVATGLGLSGGTITTSGTIIVDTASASILSRQRAANTYAPISVNGTVTNVATGYGLSGGAITTTGILIADTASSTALVSKGRLTNAIAGFGNGTVTSVATGLGLTGGTITTTGTLLVDTASTSILSRQRATNTYAPISVTGTVISIATTSPITGGTITSTGTIACATCVTSAASLTANSLMIGSGSQASAVTTTGTGVITALGVNVGSAGAFVTFNGALGTPSSGILTNCTGLPLTGLATQAATTVVANATAGSASPTAVTIATLNSMMGDTIVFQVSDLATTSTSLVNVNEDSVYVAANTKYHITVNGRCGDSGVTGGRFAMTAPSGTIEFYVLGNGTSNTIVGNSSVTSGTEASVTISAVLTTTALFNVDCYILNGATAGFVKLQARAVTSGTFTVFAGTRMQRFRAN